MTSTFENAFGISPAAFFSDVWETHGYVAESGLATGADDFLHRPLDTWSDEMIVALVNDHAAFIKSSRRLLPEVYTTADRRVIPEKVREIWSLGFTLYLTSLHERFAPIRELEERLEAELYPLKIGINFFATPPQSTGLEAHFDAHDNFVIQTLGEKRWDIWKAFKQDVTDAFEPEAYLGQVAAHAQARRPDHEITLKQGDCMYLPRGTIHAPRSIGTSHHLTVWLLSPLLDQVLDGSDERTFRETHGHLFKI